MSRLTIKEFDDSPVDYFVWQGSWHHARREPAMERAAWDSLVSAGPRLVRESPTDDQVHAGLAVAYAGLGRKDEALREMDRAEALLPYSRDPAWGADRSVLFAQACARLGDVDRAVRRLQQLLSIAAPISPAWLRVDPAYDPIRSDPRFQRLLRGR